MNTENLLYLYNPCECYVKGAIEFCSFFEVELDYHLGYKWEVYIFISYFKVIVYDSLCTYFYICVQLYTYIH